LNCRLESKVVSDCDESTLMQVLYSLSSFALIPLAYCVSCFRCKRIGCVSWFPLHLPLPHCLHCAVFDRGQCLAAEASVLMLEGYHGSAALLCGAVIRLLLWLKAHCRSCWIRTSSDLPLSVAATLERAHATCGCRD